MGDQGQRFQHTLSKAVSLGGIELRSGKSVKLKLLPAAPNTGVHFLRVDVASSRGTIAARWYNVTDVRSGIILTNEYEVSLSAIEPLLAALRFCGVDNVLAEVDGAELPALDSKIMSYVESIRQVGIKTQRCQRSNLLILRPVALYQGEKYGSLLPDRVPRITVELDARSAFEGRRSFSLEFDRTPMDPVTQTDMRECDIVGQTAKTDAKINSRKNFETVSMGQDEQQIAQLLPYLADQQLRNCLIDCVSDLALIGARIRGHLYVFKPDHTLIQTLIRKLFHHRAAWRMHTQQTPGCHLDPSGRSRPHDASAVNPKSRTA